MIDPKPLENSENSVAEYFNPASNFYLYNLVEDFDGIVRAYRADGLPPIGIIVRVTDSSISVLKAGTIILYSKSKYKTGDELYARKYYIGKGKCEYLVGFALSDSDEDGYFLAKVKFPKYFTNLAEDGSN